MAIRSDNRNYYEILHVSRDAPAEIIRGVYRTLMQQLKHHPDLGGDTATAALINEAYATLSNTERRAAYDARLAVLAGVAEGLRDAPLDEHEGNTDRVLDIFRECVFCQTPHDHGRIIDIDAACIDCGSPLCAAKNHRIESGGQRAIARIGKRQKITFYTRWPQHKGFVGRTEDISLHGLCLVTTQDLRKGEQIKIVSKVVEAVARVSHCTHERRNWVTYCVAGVSFLTLRFVRSAGGFISDRV
jgi:hypothetical protein